MKIDTTQISPRTVFPRAESSSSSARSYSRLKSLFFAWLVLICGGAAYAVETVYVSPNVLTVGGTGGFSDPDDALSGAVPIGFNFTYGGIGYTTCQMSTNGILFFANPTTAYTNTALTSMITTRGIYPLWDDLYMGPSGDPIPSTAVYYTTGTPGSRIFIMQWTNWYSYGEPFEVGTFNVVLYEGSNKIDIYYRNMLGASAARRYGTSATIGLVSPLVYVNQYSFNSPVATEGRLLTYTPTLGALTPYSLTVQDVTPATTAAIPTYFLFAATNPKQPLNLSANPGNPNATSTTLSWDLGTAGVNPLTFSIRYSTNASMAGLIETPQFAAPGQPYVLAGLTQGVTYYWQVVSRRGSTYSTSITSTFVQTPNIPPVALDGAFSTQLDTPYNGTLVATDADNAPTSSGLIYSITTPPGSGTAVITNSATGTFTYTPALGFSGSTSFGFKAFDGTAFSNEATVSINVISNLPPVITLNGPNPVTLECYVDFYTEQGATAVDPEDGSRPVTITGTVDRTQKGIYTKTYTATDSQGATTVATRTINVVDTLPPVITAPSDILVPSAVGGMSGAIFYSPNPTASDKCQGNVLVISSPPSGSTFPVGRTTVTCTSTDNSGNSATTTFDVVVLTLQPSPGTRYVDPVSVRGDTPAEFTGTIFNVNRAFLNNNGDIIYDARLTEASSNDQVVIFQPATGGRQALAIKGTASGAGNFGAFSKLTLNNLGHKGFESLIGSNPGQFADTGGGAVLSALKSGLAPTGGGETYNALYQPAMASNGELLTPAYLLLGSGAGVTIADDTVITSSAGTVIAREGSPTSIAATSYGQLHQRVVTSEAGDKYAFSAFLEEAVFTPATNTGLFVGTLGSGPPALVVREGDAAGGIAGATMFQFLGEAINSTGAVALRANVIGTGVTSLNNDGIWSNAGNILSPPVLVARESAVAPTSPNNKVAFSSFSTLHMNDDGSVVFFAFLKNATASPVVSSSNDGSIWRWSAGKLSLIAREGDFANNTAGARLLNINGFDCNDVGGVVYDSTLVPGVGDATTATNQAVFVDRGASDPAPLLVMRRNDTFDVNGTEHKVAGIKISTEVNPGGGTGGYGRAINDFGDVVFNLTLSGNKSGIFVLGTPPVPAP